MTEPFEPAAASAAADQPAQPATEPAATEVEAAPAPSPTLDDPTQRVFYSPEADRRPAWTIVRREGDAEHVAPPTPSAWYEPESAIGDGASAGRTSPTRRGGVVGVVVAASLGAAMIGSLGTYGLLSATGTLDRAVATVAPIGQAQQAAQPVPISIDESSAITRAAEKVSPAIVTIAVSGAAADPTDPFSGVPQSGVGSGVIFDSDGWIVTNKHVVSDARSSRSRRS